MVIAPSLLASDFARLGMEASRVAKSGGDWLHIDIMDGHFVPNLSMGPALVRAIRPRTKLFYDVHLMCSKPEILLEPFAAAGANEITVHVELGEHQVTPLLWKIRSLGKKVGLAINPSTTIAHVQPYLERIDLLLVMTVNPGFGGQSFIHETLPKIQTAYQWRRERGLDFRIEVDGGIDFTTAAECARAGADTYVAGTGLFKQRSLRMAIKRMRRVVEASARHRYENPESEPVFV